MILPTFQACAQLVRQLCALHMQQQQQDSSNNINNNKQQLSQHFHHALFGHNLHKLLIPVTTSPASSAPLVCVCVCFFYSSVVHQIPKKKIQNSCRQRSILYISQLNHLRHRHLHRRHHHRCHSQRRHTCCCPGRRQ